MTDADTDSMRYTYRLRLSRGQRRALLTEWDRVRRVWNQCVAESQTAHQKVETVGPEDEGAPRLNYTTRGFRLRDGRLRLAGGIAVRPVWSRNLPGTPSSVRMYRDTLGHQYASFVVAAQVEPLPDTDTAIGIDWGVTETATTTDSAMTCRIRSTAGRRRPRSPGISG